MSLNQLYDNGFERPWCNVRVNNLTVDGVLELNNGTINFQETDVVLNLTGAITATCNCKIIRIANIIKVILGNVIETSTSNDWIYANNFPSEFIPTTTTTSSPLVVLDNAIEVVGHIDFFVAGGGLRILSSNSAKFTNAANTGITGSSIFEYYLD